MAKGRRQGTPWNWVTTGSRHPGCSVRSLLPMCRRRYRRRCRTIYKKKVHKKRESVPAHRLSSFAVAAIVDKSKSSSRGFVCGWGSAAKNDYACFSLRCRHIFQESDRVDCSTLLQARGHWGLIVVWRRLRHRFGRCIQRVGEVWRMGQRPFRLGTPPVCHQPAGDGHCHCYQS